MDIGQIKCHLCYAARDERLGPLEAVAEFPPENFAVDQPLVAACHVSKDSVLEIYLNENRLRSDLKLIDAFDLDYEYLDVIRYVCTYFDISDKLWAQFGHSLEIKSS